MQKGTRVEIARGIGDEITDYSGQTGTITEVYRVKGFEPDGVSVDLDSEPGIEVLLFADELKEIPA